MKQDVSHDFHPLRLTFQGGAQGITISSVEEAAEELLCEWPGDDGDHFYEAVKACLDCLQGDAEPESARTAFVQAAREAGILIEQ